MICRILFLFVVAGLWVVRAAEKPLGLDAEVLDVTIVDGKRVAVAKGDARFADEHTLLRADEIQWEEKSDTFTASGHVTLTRIAARLLADRLVYRRTDGTFSADNIRLGSYPYFAEGFSAEGTANEVVIHRARVSYGEPGPWQPTLTADTIVIAPSQRRLRTEKANAGVGTVQPLPFPKFQHDFGQPFAGAVRLNGGFRRSLGVFAEAGLLVPVSFGARVGGDLGLYSERGVMFGPSASYSAPGDPERLIGRLRSGYINDHGDRKRDILERPIPENRAYLEWEHQQMLAPNLSLNGQVNWWKDSDVVRDFRARAFFPVQEPDTFLESTYTSDNYFISLFARFQPNRFHRVQERLPEIRFDLLPLPIGHGFYERFNASFAMLREDPLPVSPAYPTGGTPLRSDRLDAYYAIMRPFTYKEWFAFTPLAGGRVTHYTKTRGAAVRRGDYTRWLGEVGADLVLRASGTFDYRNPQWKIDGLRHLVTPRLSYRYIPEAEKGRARIPPIDDQAFSTYLQPLGLGDVRNIDDLHATNTLRVGFDNVLQTRDPVLGTRDLAVFNLANDFRFRRQPGERDVSEIHAEIALMPARWLQLDVYQSIAPQTFTLREFNSGITIRDGDAWSVRFGNNFLRQHLRDYPAEGLEDYRGQGLHDYSIDGRVRLTERFQALTRLHYDVRKRRFNEQAYGIVQNLGNTWLISYTVSLYSGRRRESSFGFNVQIDTVRF